MNNESPAPTNALPQPLDLAGIRAYFGGIVTVQDRCIAALRICDLFEEQTDRETEWLGLTLDTTELIPRVKPKEQACDTISALSIQPERGKDAKIHSLAVVLFMVCFGSNPYLGSRFYAEPLLDDKNLKKLFLTDRLFIFAPDKSNYPDLQYQSQPIALWARESMRQIRQLMEDYFVEGCGFELEVLKHQLWTTLSSIAFANSPIIQINFMNFGKYALSAGKKLISPVGHQLLGETFMADGVLKLRNLSAHDWDLTSYSGRMHTISNQQGKGNSFPLKPGMNCRINDIDFEVLKNN